ILALFGLAVFITTSKRAVVPVGCSFDDYSGEFKEGENIAFFDGEEITIPDLANAPSEQRVLGTASPSERWIEVDLSEQKLRAWDGNALFLETAVSTGLPWWPTPTGEFRVWLKVRFTKMEGGSGRYYYNLPNVPFVMFFENDSIPGWRGYGLHGTYWHNDFGTQRSHGCVNLPTPVAEQLFYWTTPNLGSKWATFASENDPGTRIVIHE
ncbi:MAG: L,D-transpeptidase, partial [Patescibacteria group bacterium]